MSAPYELRAGGDGKTKKQSMAELKLRRLNELNLRLKEDLDRRRIPVSEAATEYVTKTPRTYLLQTANTPIVQPDQFHGQGAQGLHGTVALGKRKSSLSTPSPQC